jgi:hypothetical protein
MLLASVPIHGLVAAPNSVAGERSLSPTRAAPHWVLADTPVVPMPAVEYPGLPPDAAAKLAKDNAQRGFAPLRIGIPRALPEAAAAKRGQSLAWVDAGAGDFVARVSVRSPGARSLRVGLDLRGVHPRVTLRLGGSADPARPIAAVAVADAVARAGDDGLYWTPTTDGDLQIIEIHRPAGVPAAAVRLQAPKLSHDLLDSRQTPGAAKIGESGSCNVDVICRVGSLGPAFVDAKNAVAHMRFVRGGSTFICTGTLLADTEPATQVPLFHGANHCFSSDTSIPPNPAAMQAVANTLSTFWDYETTGCGNLVQRPTIQLAGGASYLHSNHLTDGMLLRLNGRPPASAFFAGWDAAQLGAGATLYGIHHPSGDAKKVSQGNSLGQDTSLSEVGWLSGTTEGGSSGSAIFTIAAAGDYRLRGGLLGGSASCANSGSLANTSNRDYYSRLDVDFAAMRTWLTPSAVLFGDGFE